jgi:hypothetical protein
VRTVRLLCRLLPATLFAGCTTGNINPPLLFVQTQTLGVTINGSSIQQNFEMTLGYRDFDVAIVPATVTQGGASTQVQSTVAGPGTSGADALSVLGQFEANTRATPEVGLGKFFSTGLAAQKLADGFREKLSK